MFFYAKFFSFMNILKVFGLKIEFLQSLKVKFVKNEIFYEKLFYALESSMQKFRAIYPQIT